MTTRNDETSPGDALPEGVLKVRFGPGANCSSIGSVVDILFVSATVGGALLTAVAALASSPSPRASAPSPTPSPSPPLTRAPSPSPSRADLPPRRDDS